MATVIFYQKPGCRTNARQRQALEAAGHTVIARSLLAEPWTADALLGYFGATPVDAWFNKASPRLKSGEIDPQQTSAESALALMLADPLLIRRPLVECEGRRCADFDREPVPTLLGGGEQRSELQSCVRQETA